ncbi:mannitol dehydrogenase family protein [Specibacter sp. NPDC078692]|uniref:mannitol dehydrogenase family protein n=1 Tax=Specibacter sp. NPDC078692 TaxID=3155818 RepID=UPI0034490774
MSLESSVQTLQHSQLSLDTLTGAAARPGVIGPTLDPRSLTTGIVHLGVGAFHRAHQAVYTEDAATTSGETHWGILGVTGRTAKVAQQLAPQNGLYSVLTRSAQAQSLRIIASLRGVAFPGVDTDSVVAAIAAPQTQIVSTTITEKGYPRTSAGRLEISHEGTAHDIATLRRSLAGKYDAGPAATALGLLARGLGQRFQDSGAPLTVVPCDNLPSNGALTRQLMSNFAGEAGNAEFSQWLADAVAFPSTMVDRIVPATTAADQAEALSILGLQDQGLVVAEPFGQWVIEDAFAGGRPAWEQAGATITANVEPFEVAKLRMLNATHSLLAYLGALRGFVTIADAVGDEALKLAARRLQSEDVIPTLTAPDGLDLQAYGDSILERFANPALGHTTIQVAMDGSEKLPIRLLGTVSDRLAAGSVPESAALAVAAWMVFVYRGRDVNGETLTLDDPAAQQLHNVARGIENELSERMFALGNVFPQDVSGHLGFRKAVASHVHDLLREIR